MLASFQQEGLQVTITPGLTWDSEQRVFKGQVLYGDEILTLCITKERMQNALNTYLNDNADIEPLFHPAAWIPDAEREHEPAVYFENEDDFDL